MATTKGNHITDFDQTPADVPNARLHGGALKGSVDQFELGTASTIHHVFKVPVEAVLHSCKFGSDDLGTAGTVDIGFYKKNNDGTYTAVDDDAIASAIAVTSAVAYAEQRFEAANINTADQPAWELAGLSARPAYGDLYISLTMDTQTTAAGTVAMSIQYTE